MLVYRRLILGTSSGHPQDNVGTFNYYWFVKLLSNILSDLLVVVEMVLDALDDLVVFVSFSCDEDDVSLTRERTGSLDSRSTIFDDENVM